MVMAVIKTRNQKQKHPKRKEVKSMLNETMEREELKVEEAKIVENKGCSACAIGAACLADGPIPDFEVAGVLAIYGVTG